MPAFHAVQHLDMRQQTRMAPRLQQAVKLLQMSALEFATALRATLSNNPFLDEPADESAPAGLNLSYGQDAAAVDTAPAPHKPEAPAEPPMDPAAVPLAAGGPSHPSPPTGIDPVQWASTPTSLKDHLLSELRGYHLSDRDALMAQYIVDALDDDGYLRASLEELAAPGAFERAPRAGEWQAALALVQQLAQPGLAARDLCECLTLQLRALPPSEQVDLALPIVRHHLPQLARRDYGAIERALGATPQAVQAACDLIRRLDPKPGRRYDGSAAQYVVPDVFVTRHRSGWRVVPNAQACPLPRLHDTYAELFRRARSIERGPLAQELRDARWLIRNVSQRYRTIHRVAEIIVERQQRFFTEGDVALRPLMLREVADELHMHESTVSRAAANKYMMTPRGLLEFHHFFSREMATRSGEGCSAAAIRARIKTIIDGEDPARPLSDVCIVDRLAEQGIVIARRTVSKYRGQLRIPSAELRRAAGRGRAARAER